MAHVKGDGKAKATERDLTDMVFALGRNWYVLLQNAENEGDVLPFDYTGAQLIRSARYLRFKNSNDLHVYGRPVSTRHVLVDDLEPDALDALAANGLTPAVVVETSRIYS